MTSGASWAATDVARRSKYEVKATESVVTLMLGLAASKALTASLVILARAVLPHHENRMVTGCAAEPRLEPEVAVFAPLHAAIASKDAPRSPTPRTRRVRRPVSPPFTPRVDRIAVLSCRAIAALRSGIGQRHTRRI